jgi:tRNA threonylcarbamoyladenosine modification (KEOPS) complex Cgi121 subunit
VGATSEAFIGARGQPVVHVDMWMRQLQRAAKSLDMVAQAVDASAVCGRVHLESAYLHADRAVGRGNNLARTLLVEWVLCAAGVRQVDVAFRLVGIRPGTDTFAIMLIADDDLVPTEDQVGSLLGTVGLQRDDDVLECDEEALRILGVGDAELAAVPRASWPDLALERVALLELER